MTESIKNSDELSPYCKALYLDIESQQRAVNSDRKSFDDLVKSAKWFGAIASVMVVGIGFFVGQSMKDVHKTAEEAATNAFGDAIRSKTRDGQDLEKIIKNAEETSKQLEIMKDRLAGYDALAKVANTASNFDPLVEYFKLDREIDKRVEKDREFSIKNTTVNIEETTSSPQFRQYASVIFEKLIESVRNDNKNGRNRFDSVTLYNISANASKVDMDFVALELMEFAYKLGKSPEIESRLIRQRLGLSRISPEEAIEGLKAVLRKTPGFDIHHVLSEAFNIGQHTSTPVRIATVIEDNIDKSLQNISYVHLTVSRLLLMGNTKFDWEKGMQSFSKGLLALSEEPSSARWVEHSRDTVRKILSENPDLIKKNQGILSKIFE